MSSNLYNKGLSSTSPITNTKTAVNMTPSNLYNKGAVYTPAKAKPDYASYINYANAKTAEYDRLIQELLAKRSATQATQPTATPVAKTVANVVTNKSNRGVQRALTTVKEPDPWYYSGDEIAKRFGIVNDYATVLAEMQGATSKKFDELNTQTLKAKDDSLRTMQSQYQQYLDGIRSAKSNAVATGISKGTAAAQQIAAMLGGQQQTAASQQTLTDLLNTINEQRATALATDVNTARTQTNEMGKYLSQIGATYDSNAINKYAAQLAADAQTRAAQIAASGQTSAARINANAGYDTLMNYLIEYNKGDKNAALSQYFNDYYPYAIGAKTAATTTK